MTVFTTAPAHRAALAARLAGGDPLVVVALCAAWCNTCTEFRDAFGRIADARPDALFVWLDIEDDHAVAGDVDVENFPTLAVYRGSAVLHFGVALPHEAGVARLVAELASRDGGLAAPPPAVAALAQALRHADLA
jgi:thioredoxin reductase (NADPH)